MNKEDFDILRLARAQGTSIALLHKSLKLYDTPDNVIKNIKNIKSSIVLPTEDEVNTEIELCEKDGATIISYKNPLYPQYLRNIPTFPLVLTCKGNLDLLKNERKLAIVGSRACSINSYNFTKKIAEEVSNYGYVVVSGMAKGIDSAAHYGSMKNGTIAVLGTGVNKIYPKENEYLYYEILKNNGLIVSEFPYNTSPKPENFPIRNRIVVGLSRGILIANAGEVSGTTYTAKQALEFNREIMVFPGSPYDEKSFGSNKLIMEGANMVLNSKDIIEYLETFMPSLEFLNDNDETYHYNRDYTKIIDKYNYSDEFMKVNSPITLEDEILTKLDFVPIVMDDLVDNLKNYDISVINSTLMKLRLDGKINMEAGKVFLML